MDKRKYLDGVFTRINYLTSMASLEEPDIEALLIEYSSIIREIDELKTTINAYTPTKADLDNAKNKDQLRLSSKRSELGDLQYDLKELSKELEEKKKEFENLISKINQLTSEIEHLNQEDKILSMHKPLSREFKQFVADNKKNIQDLKVKVEELTLQKSRVQNSITVLSDKKTTLTDQIKMLSTSIKVIEQDLGTDKAYENVGIIKEKNLIKDNYSAKLTELEKRKVQIENTPAFLANKIKELLENSKDKQQVLSMLDKIYGQAKSQPYMSLVIRNGNTKTLLEEYETKRMAREDIEQKIRRTNYSLKELPVEKLRKTSLEKLINLYNSQITSHEELINRNNVAISSLASQVKSISTDYQQKQDLVTTYHQNFEKLPETSFDYAHKKREYEKMQNILQEIKNKITLYKENITELIKQNVEEQKIIDSLKNWIKKFNLESTEILNSQMTRNNYYDVIRRNSDMEELSQVKKDLKYIEKRSTYRNYNITTLYSEIKQGINTIFKTQNISKNQKPITKSKTKVVLEPVKSLKKEQSEIKPVVADIPTESITALDDLLAKSKLVSDQQVPKVTKEEVQGSVDDFENTIDSFLPKEQSINLNIDVPTIVLEEKQKMDQNDQENLKLYYPDYEKLASALKISLKIPDEVMVKKDSENNLRQKVIKIEPVLSKNNVKAQNARLKVVSVVPLRKKEIPKETPLTNGMDLEKAFNLVYRPFDVSDNLSLDDDNLTNTIEYKRAA